MSLAIPFENWFGEAPFVFASERLISSHMSLFGKKLSRSRPSPAAPFHSSMHSPAKTKMHRKRQGEGRPRESASGASAEALRGARYASLGVVGNESELFGTMTTLSNSETNSIMWTMPDSNRLPHPCHGCALPGELMALVLKTRLSDYTYFENFCIISNIC